MSALTPDGDIRFGSGGDNILPPLIPAQAGISGNSGWDSRHEIPGQARDGRNRDVHSDAERGLPIALEADVDKRRLTGRIYYEFNTSPDTTVAEIGTNSAPL